MVAKGCRRSRSAIDWGSRPRALTVTYRTLTPMGVSTRAAAALFAMQHSLTSWGELPISDMGQRS